MLLKELKTLNLSKAKEYKKNLVMCYHLADEEYCLFNFTKTECSNNTDVYVGISMGGMRKIRISNFQYLSDSMYMKNPTSFIVLKEMTLTAAERRDIEVRRIAILKRAQSSARYRDILTI